MVSLSWPLRRSAVEKGLWPSGRPTLPLDVRHPSGRSGRVVIGCNRSMPAGVLLMPYRLPVAMRSLPAVHRASCQRRTAPHSHRQNLPIAPCNGQPLQQHCLSGGESAYNRLHMTVSASCAHARRTTPDVTLPTLRYEYAMVALCTPPLLLVPSWCGTLPLRWLPKYRKTEQSDRSPEHERAMSERRHPFVGARTVAFALNGWHRCHSCHATCVETS